MQVDERFVPDHSLTHEEMEALQRDLAAEAVFEDAFGFDADRACASNATLGGDEGEPPLVAGVDQAFLGDDRAVSAIVVSRGGEVVERVHAVTDVEVPYVPGLLAFREGGSILAAFDELDREPDLALFDGSGRIHFREAGLATHVGVTLDLPAVGVAKSLLCGRPRGETDDLSERARVPIEADDSMTAPDGTVVGYAVQTRQYDSANQSINPLYVSPGHRVDAETAADLVSQCAAGYKLPEPTRLADRYADEAKDEYE